LVRPEPGGSSDHASGTFASYAAEAINRALAQRATVEFCDADLDVIGGIGAVERF
jgi:hypothetical protein